jgi:hypothetical protein
MPAELTDPDPADRRMAADILRQAEPDDDEDEDEDEEDDEEDEEEGEDDGNSDGYSE